MSDPGLGGWPEWARTLVKILTGDEPPSALPQKAVDAGHVYDRLARDLDQMMEMARNVSLKIGDGMPEEARRQFEGVVDSFSSGRGKKRLDEFLGQLHGVRLDLEDKSRQIYEMYWQVMAAVLQMLALLVWVAVLAAFGFGGLGGLTSAIFNRARVAVLASIAQLLQRIKVLPGVFEAFEEALLSFAVQLGNKVFGNKQFRRDSLDWGSIGKDALFGLFAGGIGEVLGGAFHKGKDLLSKLGHNSPDFGNSGINPANWDRLIKEGFDNANDFVSEGFGESLGAAAMGLFFAGYSFSWATFVSAGSSGLVERNLEQGVAGAAHWLRSKFVNPPPTPDGVNTDRGHWPPRSVTPDPDPDSNTNAGPDSPRNTDRNEGTNGRTGPRTDINTSGGTRRPPLTTSNLNQNGTGGGNPSRDGNGSWNGSGNPNGNGAGRPPVVATSTHDLPDLSTYQPDGDTPPSTPSTPTPNVVRSDAGQDTWQLPDQPRQFVADPTGGPGTFPSNGQDGRSLPVTGTGPGNRGFLSGTGPVAGDVTPDARPDGQRPGAPQPVRTPEPTVEGNPVRTLGTDPAPGTTPANPSDPLSGTGPRSMPQPSVTGTGDPAFQADEPTTATHTTTATDATTGSGTTGVTEPTPGNGTFTGAASPEPEVPGQNELTIRQQDVLIGQGTIPRASAPGQDSLVLALGASAPDLVTGTPGDVRAHLSQALVAELDANPDTGSRPLWDTIDAQAQAAVADDRTADRLRLGETLTRQEIYAQELQAVHDTWGDDERRSLAEAMRTYTSASDATDDILPLVAGQVYGLSVNIVQPDGSTMLVGSPDARPVTVARLPRTGRADEERNNRDRWLAAAPDPARMPDEAFQAYWNHLPTDTAGFVRAAAAARSLLAEQGRVTDPLTSTPFSALTADGRAARRLAVVFHGDSGLYRNPARRDEALARALELLDDPAPVRPVTESSTEPEAVPDVVSTTGPDPDTLVDEWDDAVGPEGRQSERSFQRRWDKLKNTPAVVEAAATAQSLLAEHGRVTDPLTPAPFSELDRADRAARRLTEMLHSDPGLRTDPARQDEARAWALQLLEDPLFPIPARASAPTRPVMESADLSDDESDTTSIFSSVSSDSSLSSVASDKDWQRLPDDDDSDLGYSDSTDVDFAESLPLLPRPDLDEKDETAGTSDTSLPAAPPEPGTPEPGTPSPPVSEEGAASPAEQEPDQKPEQKPEPEDLPSYPADRVNPARSTTLVSAVSKHLRAGRRRTARLLAYQWFDVKAVDRLRRELGLRRGSDLLDLAESIGRVPEDLPRIAAELGLTPIRLFKIARDFGADPRHISVVLGPTLRQGGDKAARDLVRSAGWRLGAHGGHPEAGAHPRGKGWLLAVAAHHRVSWEGLTYPYEGLAHRLSRHTSTVPVLTPPAHTDLADVVEEWIWNHEFGPRGVRSDYRAAWERDTKSAPPVEGSAPAAWEEASQVARASQQAGTMVTDLLTDRGAVVTPEQRATLIDTAAAHLFLDPADPEEARTAVARLLDEANDAAVTAARRTDLPFDPVAFDRLWESARQKAVGENLESALADARGLVGPLRRLPASFDRDTDAYLRLKPEDQVVRRVAHHLYTWPGDTEGARDLAERLVRDLPPERPGLFAGAKSSAKKKAKKRATAAESVSQEPGTSTGPGTATAATPAAAAPNSQAGGLFNGIRLSPENAHELVRDAYDQWRAWNPGDDRSTPESRAAFIADAVPSLLDYSNKLSRSHPDLVLDGAVIAFILSHQLHPDSPDTLPAETLTELAKERGVMDAASRSAHLANAVDKQRWLITRLTDYPDLLDTLGDPDLQGEVGPLLGDRDAVERILGDSNLLGELEKDRNLRHIVMRNHQVVMALGGDAKLVRLIMGNDQLSLTSYLVGDVPAFASLLSDLAEQGPDRAVELAQILGAVRDSLELQYEIYDHAEVFREPEQFHRLLTDRPLLSAMRSHPGQIKTVLGAPGMLDASHRDPGTLSVLDSDPFLSDVLLDHPELGERLAGAPELLRAAYANPHLAATLSEDPHALHDALTSNDQDTLTQVLASAAPAPPTEEPAPALDDGGGTESRFHHALRTAFTGHEELIRTLFDDPEAGNIVTGNPGLLTAPHEYRRLLHPEHGKTARALLLQYGDAMLVPGMLRVMLRHSWVRRLSPTLKDQVHALAETLRRQPELVETYHRSGAYTLRAMVSANSYAVATGTEGFTEAVARDGLLLSVFNDSSELMRLLHAVPDVLPALMAGDTALLELAARFPLVLNALLRTPAAIGAGGRHTRVLKALVAAAAEAPESARTSDSATTRTAGHWSRFLLGDTLLDALATEQAAPLLPLLATDAEVFNAVVERPAVAQVIQQNPQRFTTLLADRPALLSEIRGGGARTLTETGLDISAQDAARLRTLALPHEAARNVLRGAKDETGLRVLDSLHEAYGKIPGLQEAVAADDGLLHLLYANAELLPTLRHRPDLLPVLTAPSKNAQRALHLNTRLTAALRTNGPLYRAFVQDSFLVEELARDWTGGDQIAGNRSLFRFVRVPHLRGAFGYQSPAERLIAADETMTDALLRDGRRLLPSLQDNDPFFEELLELRGDGSPERVHRLDAVIRAVTADAGGPLLKAVAGTPGLARILFDAPTLTAALTAHPKAFLHVDEVRGLLSDAGLVASLEQAHTVTEQILASRDLLAATADEPRLPEAMRDVPGFADLLAHHPELHPLGAMGLATDVLADPSLVRALRGLQGLAEAVIAEPALSGQLRKPGVLALVRAHRVLVREAHRQSRLWRALDHLPALVTAVTEDPALLAKAAGRANLLDTMTEASQELTGEDLRDLFADEAFTTLLNNQPSLAKTVLGDPELLRYGLAQPHFQAAVLALGTGKRGKLGRVAKAGPDALRRAVEEYAAAHPAPADPATPAPVTEPDPAPAPAPAPVPTAASVPTPAQTRSRAARTPGQAARLAALAESAPSVAEILAQDQELTGWLVDHPAILTRLPDHPEVAALLIVRPDLVELLDADPDALPSLTYTDYTGKEPLTGNLDQDLDGYLGSIDVALAPENRTLVRDALQPVWRRHEDEHRTAVEQRIEQVRARFTALDPADPRTWEFSRQVRYANRMHEGLLGGHEGLLSRLASGEKQPREGSAYLNGPLHTHLGSGWGGLTYAYVANPEDGTVDLLVYGYAKRRARSGNDYVWENSGTRSTSGPLPIEYAEDAPELIRSLDLVERLRTRGGVDTLVDAYRSRQGVTGRRTAQAPPSDRISRGPWVPGPVPSAVRPDAAWAARRDDAPVVYLDTERFDPAPSSIAEGRTVLIRSQIRRIQVTPDLWVRDVTLDLPVVGLRNDEREVFEQRLQGILDRALNDHGRRFKNSGDRLHVRVQLKRGDTHDDPIVVTSPPAGERLPRADQLHLDLGDTDGFLFHELLHYLGESDRYVSDEAVFRSSADSTAVRDGGVMSDPEGGLVVSETSLAAIEAVHASGPVILDHPLPRPAQSAPSTGRNETHNVMFAEGVRVSDAQTAALRPLARRLAAYAHESHGVPEAVAHIRIVGYGNGQLLAVSSTAARRKGQQRAEAAGTELLRLVSEELESLGAESSAADRFRFTTTGAANSRGADVLFSPGLRTSGRSAVITVDYPATPDRVTFGPVSVTPEPDPVTPEPNPPTPEPGPQAEPESRTAREPGDLAGAPDHQDDPARPVDEGGAEQPLPIPEAADPSPRGLFHALASLEVLGPRELRDSDGRPDLAALGRWVAGAMTEADLPSETVDLTGPDITLTELDDAGITLTPKQRAQAVLTKKLGPASLEGIQRTRYAVATAPEWPEPVSRAAFNTVSRIKGIHLADLNSHSALPEPAPAPLPDPVPEPGSRPAGSARVPVDADPLGAVGPLSYEGMSTPGASGSGLRSQEQPDSGNASLPASLSDLLAVAGPVPVAEMSPEDWIRDRDARDEGLLFAPPAAFTSASLRQYGGAGTFDLSDGRLYGEIRGAIVRAVPVGVREGVRRALDERFSVESFISELPQAIGDRLVLGLHADGVYFEAAVRVRVGDWRQVTDPHGRRLPGTEQFLPPSVSWKREPRTRQLLESGESVGSSRTRAHGIGLPAAIVLNYTIDAIPHLSSVAALFSSVLAGYSASSTSTVSSGATTARYTKGTYRAVDFLYDVLFDVTVQGGSVAPRQHQDVLERALVGRHDRRLLQSRPRPSEDVTHATSEWWQEPVPPSRRGTALLRDAVGTLGQHRALAGRDTTAYQEWRPVEQEEGDGPDPAVGPGQLRGPLPVPRTSVVESFDHAEQLRRAVFSVLPESMSRVGTPEKSAVDAFTAVHSIAGALHRAMAGGYLSVPFSTGGGVVESVELSTVLHDVEVVKEEDGTPRVDWMIHIDTEDVNVDNVAHRHSGSDAVSLSASALLGTGAGQFGSTVSVPALGGSRSVGVSDPGQQAGSVTLHKVKLEEPTVVLAGRTLTTVRGRGRAETVEGTTRVRILLQDAIRLGLIDPRQAPRATVDGPHAGNVELHARTSPGRRLRFAPALGGWLPQLSRVDSVDHGDAGRLMERVLRAVRAAAPDMLPPEAGANGVKAHEHTNLMTITNLVRPEPLAARLHDIVNGGISVVLSRPGLTGPQEVVLTLSGTLDPDDFTHRGMWDGNSETYYGGFYELQGDRSTAFSLEGGFDVPLNYSSTPDQFTFRGAGGRIAPRVGTGWVTTTGGGFSVGGASGGGSRFMAGFEGAVDVRVTVSRSRPPA
ncbi:hypothetical protein ACFCX0_32180, partial [Streptomyces sp. NPDC056352]|uniref:hypothetical protein n=1 Tax=Streptomyces sp. NPDC056352 TaxID=3345791 RepID=UPI0035DF58AD